MSHSSVMAFTLLIGFGLYAVWHYLSRRWSNPYYELAKAHFGTAGRVVIGRNRLIVDSQGFSFRIGKKWSAFGWGDVKGDFSLSEGYKSTNRIAFRLKSDPCLTWNLFGRRVTLPRVGRSIPHCEGMAVSHVHELLNTALAEYRSRNLTK